MHTRQHLGLWWLVLAVFLLSGGLMPHLVYAAPADCKPTPPDSLGPFYEPNAPQRDTTGQGFTISGVVRSAQDCRPLAAARLEWWSANAQGNYDATHRATQPTGTEGQYQYTTDTPGRYPGRPPHLHVRITAPGHRTLVTQVYPKPTETHMTMDFILEAQ
jgi:protocatechuate 3,4-dioxygenase beta subunit